MAGTGQKGERGVFRFHRFSYSVMEPRVAIEVSRKPVRMPHPARREDRWLVAFTSNDAENPRGGVRAKTPYSKP